MLLKGEQIENIYEYSPNQLVISLYPAEILITKDWQYAHVIMNYDHGNIQNHWVLPVPFQYSEGVQKGEPLPFIVVSGRESFSLINMKDFTKQKLIAAPSCNIRCQQAFFFKKEEYGYCIHFTAKSASDGYNLEDQKWYMLPFKPDF